MDYKRLNNIFGWAAFIVAAVVYFSTVERTAGFWDCSERTATSFKLLIAHPPGAPFFQLMGRFFSMFAFGNVENVGYMVNIMSSLCAAFTVLFLFWTITWFAKKMIVGSSTAPVTNPQLFTILGSGLVGALAFTFSDSFWFTAVESEVYAMSYFFTALVFWAMTKWETVANEKHSLKWLVLISYLIGLSIGVHLLNLLAIPALVLIYYFKKYEKITWQRTAFSFIIGLVLLAFIMMGIIPLIPTLAGIFERIFVNGFGLPLNTGIIFYSIALIAAIVWGIRYTHRKRKPVLNTIIICITVLIIGYTSYLMLVIRSNANVTIDENAPDNAVSLRAYLAREQYGDWPVLTGYYYNAPVVNMEDGKPVYTQKYIIERDNREVAGFYNKWDANNYIDSAGGKMKGRYVISDHRRGTVPIYDERFKAVFPRMWSQQRAHHATAYKEWAHKDRGERIQIGGTPDQPKFTHIPTMGENLKFFFKYQLGHMYFRYFMWNFAGRQNDIQGHGSPLHGNWISGIKAIDNALVGPQDNIPEHLKNNTARNKFYLLPLLLGIIGLVSQTAKDHRYSIIVMVFFVMTGIAIIAYLNQYPYQPRERDYSYAASFYAFSIWIGLGVVGIVQWIDKNMRSKYIPIAVTTGALLLVPGIMAKEGWDNHDRSKKVLSREVAANYLNPCGEKGIIFTNGDNDTFPLWFVQEVEGVRTDVKVVNLSLFNTDWYIDQSIRKSYEAPGIPISFTKEQYIQGSRDYVFIVDIDDSDNVRSENIIINYFMDDILERDQHIYGNAVNGLINAMIDALNNSKLPERFPNDYQKLTDGSLPFSEILNFINTRGKEQNRSANEDLDIDTDFFMDLSRRAKVITDRIVNSHIDVDLLIEWIKSDIPASKLPAGSGRMLEWFPTNKVRLKVDSAKVVDNGLVPLEDAHLIEDYVEWVIDERGIQKNHIMMLDMLATNNWERPIHFAITTGDDSYLHLMPWFRHDGMVYTLVPIRNPNEPVFLFTMFAHGTTNTDILYDIVMNKNIYDGLYNEGVYYDETARRPLVSYRNNFTRLAKALINDDRKEEAIEVLDKCLKLIPKDIVPYDGAMIPIMAAYFEAGDTIKGLNLAEELLDKAENEFNYYISFDSRKRAALNHDIANTYRVAHFVGRELKKFGQEAMFERTQTLESIIAPYIQQ